MHKYRIGFVTGLAAGFVLGTKAGRERYEQMKKAARGLADNPSVQQAAGAVQAQASELATTAGSKISDGVRERMPQLAKNARSLAEDKVPGIKHKNGHNHNGNRGHSNGTTERASTAHSERSARH